MWPDMPDETITAENEQIRADADFVRESSGASIASTESTGRSARAVVLFELIEGPTSARAIGNGTSLSTGQVSQALSDLENRDIVELLVSEDDSDGSIFGVLPRGEKAAVNLEK